VDKSYDPRRQASGLPNPYAPRQEILDELEGDGKTQAGGKIAAESLAQYRFSLKITVLKNWRSWKLIR